MGLLQAASVASLAVLVAMFGYKFGLLMGFVMSILSVIVYCYSGLGTQRMGVVSVELTDRPKKAGQTRPRVRRGVKAIKTKPDGVSTLYENFQNGVKLAGDRPCLGVRRDGTGDFETETYKEVSVQINYFGAGLFKMGLKEKDRVGFYAKNSREWVVGAEACNAYSLTSVAIYDTLGEENREYIVNQSEIRAVCTTGNLLKNLIALASQCPKLKFVILNDGASDAQKADGKKVGLTVLGFKEVQAMGKDNFRDPIPPKPEDLAILMYTSGTTSRPKGVMISHANVVAVISGVLDVIPNLTNQDRYLSYLPLAHILERAAEATMFNKGAAIGFFQGDIRKLTKDIEEWAPSIYAGVPKVYQRIMNGIKKKISESPLPVRVIFAVGYHLKKKSIELGLPSGILDKIVFKKIHAAMGGNVRLMVSGGAPLSAECHEFCRVVFGAPFSQGYGLTETCGGANATHAGMVDPYTKSGAPFSCSEIKLVSAGKYSVDHNPPQGEVCVRGGNVTLGYYKNQEKTDEVFVVEEDGERWFHTGDVGQWNPDGTLSIVGRVKDIFKLDSGEYISPERLETIYCQCKYLSNIFVYGTSDKSNVVAVAVPDAVAAKQWADQNGIKYSQTAEPDTPKEICESKEFNKLITEQLLQIANSAKLNRYEQVPIVHIDGTYWAPETGMVTDAMKNKRDPLYQQFEAEIKAMYKELGQ